MTKKQIQDKINQYKEELDQMVKEYNEHVKRFPSTPRHEDFASETKYFKRKVLEGKMKLTEEIIAEYEEKLTTHDSA